MIPKEDTLKENILQDGIPSDGYLTGGCPRGRYPTGYPTGELVKLQRLGSGWKLHLVCL